MSTARTFSAMLNEHLSYNLLREEMKKRVWLLDNVAKDNDWKGGGLIVPFKGSQASSVSWGSLTAASDVHEGDYVRGEITTQPEIWGTLLFQQRDLMEHDRVSEKSFLKILPDALEDFLDYMKEAVSLSFTNGAAFAAATADGTVGGDLEVDRVERFCIGQKCQIDDDDSAAVTGYVRSINVETNVVNFYDARSGGAAVDLSAYSVAQNAKVYFDNSQGNPVTSLRQSLLSAANGGDANLYGVSKLAWPSLQAIQVSGVGVTAANLLEKLFDGYTTIKVKGKGKPDVIVMSFKHLGSIMKKLEQDKGAYHIDQKSMKVSAYGWTEIKLFGVKGSLRVVGIEEMNDDWIGFLDLRSLKLHSNGFFKKRTSPDGDAYFEVRNTTGYQYLVDMCFFGDLVLSRPSYCGIMHTITY